jgi:YHS domain-containing protein
MKKMHQYLLLAACAAGLTVLAAKAATNSDTSSDAVMPSCCSGIPDLLKTCPVSGDKLNGDMGAPYVFSYQGQEVKLCCKSCKKDFDKDPAKYLKLIRAADKKSDKK